MGFRDDREAGLQRIDVLERELEAARKDLEASDLRAAEVDDLRKRLAALAGEKAQLDRGVSPAWMARNQRLRVWVAVLAAALLLLGYVGYQAFSRWRSESVRIQARTDADLSTCEGELEQLRQQRDAARRELDQIDQAHDAQAQELDHALLAARRAGGPTLVMAAHVTSQTGFQPASFGPDCLLTLRALGRGLCAAEVRCGDARVFPYNEPAPDVRCVSDEGLPWTPELPLRWLRAGVDSTPSPLLLYDAEHALLEVRETGAPTFSLRLRPAAGAPLVLR